MFYLDTDITSYEKVTIMKIEFRNNFIAVMGIPLLGGVLSFGFGLSLLLGFYTLDGADSHHPIIFVVSSTISLPILFFFFWCVLLEKSVCLSSRGISRRDLFFRKRFVEWSNLLEIRQGAGVLRLQSGSASTWIWIRCYRNTKDVLSFLKKVVPETAVVPEEWTG